MVTIFSPKLEILPGAQRTLWSALVQVPAEFVLYGGTAIALHLGHREAKDYLDLDAIARHGIGLPDALAAASAIYGSSFNPQITLKALSFFDDGNLTTLSQEVRSRIVEAVAMLDLDLLPVLKASQPV